MKISHLVFTLASFTVCTIGGYAQQPVQVSTLATGLNASGGLAVGPDNNIYVADLVTKNYKFVSGQGTQIIRAFLDGTSETFADGLDFPVGLAFGTDGFLYFSQRSPTNGIIQKISPDGIVSGYFSSALGLSLGIVFGADGSLFVALVKLGSPRIVRITPTRINTLFSDSALLDIPLGVAIDDMGNVYASQAFQSELIKFTPGGTASIFADLPSPSATQLINGMIVFANGRLYVVAQSDRRVYQITTAGVVSAIAGTGFPGLTDGSAFEASFYRPMGIAASVTGDTLYVGDSGDINSPDVHPNSIRMITGVHNALTSPVATEAVDTPTSFSLDQNYPNPFNPQTTISYRLAATGRVQLQIFNVLGERVAFLEDGIKSTGEYDVSFDASSLSSGIYFYSLTAGDFSQTKKMVILK